MDDSAAAPESSPPPLLQRQLNDDIAKTTKSEKYEETGGMTDFLVRWGLLESFWRCMTRIGMRRCGRWLQRRYPAAYGKTVFYWKHKSPPPPPTDNTSDDAAAVAPRGYFALTIDDGLCRNHHSHRSDDNNDEDDGASSSSMVRPVLELLEQYGASATFFVCGEYIPNPEEGARLLRAGHEMGNHMNEDRSGYYCYLSGGEFRTELQRARDAIQRCYTNYNEQNQQQKYKPPLSPPKWFRAPQGIMTETMQLGLEREGMVNVLGDVYCDDWAFAQAHRVDPVASLMLEQLARNIQHGGSSIVIFHMPEYGFRQKCFDALKDFLEGAREMGLRGVSLTEMEQLLVVAQEDRNKKDT